MLHDFSALLSPTPINIGLSLGLLGLYALWIFGRKLLEKKILSDQEIPSISAPLPPSLSLREEFLTLKIDTSKEVFYSELSHIFKKYLSLSQQKNISSLTTKEILTLPLPSDYTTLLVELMHHQYDPEMLDNGETRKKYYETIDAILDHYENYESK